MAWNPDTYNKFKSERYQPFYDLVGLIKVKTGLQVVDLGCGTGELTRKLSDHLIDADVTGIDSSAEMLDRAAEFRNEKTSFRQQTIEERVHSPGKFDLIFSNAALQWVADHHRLLPAIISLLNKGGQLAIQVPSNHHHFSHATLAELAATEPYSSALEGWRGDRSVLGIDEYAQIFFDKGASEMTVFEKLYPHVLKDADAIVEWVSGTAILRWLEKLPDSLKESFLKNYRERIQLHYGSQSPVFYGFRRILMHAVF